MPVPVYTVTHSEWGEDPYGWQVRMNGDVIDTYADKALADAYVAYQTKRAVLNTDSRGV